ncbi:Mitochondrial import inner membrane translocase subunit tim8 [Aspergillus melleus]|uniref:Mitochondrial import inner membrane translocase subunit tim8 n=1 Tax=Aspergillus melleus TaxID=138277 RepID=A0ACC3BE48_9EURO|nr:Mitochondrial import inner membrane translocase subunit tim8 [Aspergillus melleus]
MSFNLLTTRLLSGFLFALTFLFLFHGTAARALHAHWADDNFLLENATLPLQPRDDHHAENLLHFLSKRAPPETVEEGARKAESELLCYFGADDAPTQAGWKDEDLDKWYSDTNYYSDGSDIPPDGLSFTGKTLAKEMAALKIPAKIGDRGLQKFHWRQNKEFEFNGKEYDGTPGYYKGVMSVERGFISAEDNVNPAPKPGAAHPPLYKLSDVYFAEWQRQAGESKNIKKLRYFLRYHIENEDTLAIISEITNEFTTLEEWPGTEFTIYKRVRGQVQGTDEGKALLRTPNGVGVAYFLLTNKKVLGKRIPDTVRIWKTQEGVEEDITWVHMLFHIVEYKGV